mmetsp:Transcript_27827/g.60826  ORF Transcript_27827/g.60826 Transcript_27827/m.60826 type:complete len:201 (-) Transcript_27827:57-659(-)
MKASVPERKPELHKGVAGYIDDPEVAVLPIALCIVGDVARGVLHYKIDGVAVDGRNIGPDKQRPSLLRTQTAQVVDQGLPDESFSSCSFRLTAVCLSSPHKVPTIRLVQRRRVAHACNPLWPGCAGSVECRIPHDVRKPAPPLCTSSTVPRCSERGPGPLHGHAFHSPQLRAANRRSQKQSELSKREGHFCPKGLLRYET